MIIDYSAHYVDRCKGCGASGVGHTNALAVYYNNIGR